MKITKLKQGWVIRLSDSEMDVLGALVDEGEGGIIEGNGLENSGWSPQMKSAYTRRINQANRFLSTDENRRRS